MHPLIGIIGLLLIAIVLWDAFETIILPRRVTRRVRLTRLLYRSTWGPCSAIARRISNKKRREALLSFYGPLSLIMLLTVWALGLVFSFALIHWAVRSNLGSANAPAGFLSDLYFSGTTFFTLGLGDVMPFTGAGRFLTVAEAGMGIGFLALVISYLPVLYQAFSRREVNISMLDARAGTPPTAGELLRRHREAENLESLDGLLRDWERWAADLLESHLSYPVLCFFRSQHDNQSWLSALSTVLDTCSLVMVGIDGMPKWQAQLTFKMARHTVVDIAQIFNTSPLLHDGQRLKTEDLSRLRLVLSEAGVALRNEPGDDDTLMELRAMYEPYIEVLSRFLMMPLPGWLPKPRATDNWQTSAWEVTPAATDQPFRKCMGDIVARKVQARTATAAVDGRD
jgi:hypothetical protein